MVITFPLEEFLAFLSEKLIDSGPLIAFGIQIGGELSAELGQIERVLIQLGKARDFLPVFCRRENSDSGQPSAQQAEQ